jgi:DNA repair protein RecO (recombination protein O)
VNRYRVAQGIVLRRQALPSGDVVVTLLTESGKWRAVARKGKLVGGNLGRLSLFHEVTVQYYRRSEDDLALLTQVQLSGALSRLSAPSVYPYAHVLAELVDKLTVDVHLGEQVYSYLASGLRGLAQHPDPEAVTLAYAWKLLAQAGLAPRMQRCVHCDRADSLERFDAAAGGVSCSSCAVGIKLSPDAIGELERLTLGTIRRALEQPLAEREVHWRLLTRYVLYHVAELQSLARLRELTAPPPV